MLENILIVDDDKRLRELLEDYLSEKKYEIYLSDDFNTAKEIIQYFVFDLIIIDRMMPSGDGIDLIKIIKEKNDTPVILLTAMGEIENRIEGLKYGADDYLSKPFEPEELYLRIQKLLGLFRINKFNTNSFLNIIENICKKNNVEIQTNKTVEKINILNQNVNSVLLNTGEVIETSAIISNTDPKTTYLELVGASNLDTDFIRRTKNYRTKGTVAKVNIEFESEIKIKNLDGKETIGGFSLSIGNPHVIFFVDDCGKFDLNKIGPLIENHSYFPEKCNVTLATVKNKKHIIVKVGSVALD